MISFRNGVERAFGRNAANWYTVFQASQFHMMYYASRTLPNFFALGLSKLVSTFLNVWQIFANSLQATLAMWNLLPRAGSNPASKTSRGRYSRALSLLAATGVIFRSEIAVLLCSHMLYLFFQPSIRLPLSSIIPAGLIGTILGLTLTVPIDSFFWQQWPLWPELAGFVYNVVDKQSSNWGTQAWHFYFTSALPRLLFNPFVYQICLPFTLSIPILRHSALDIVLPNLLYLIVYSFQPHKEWRFIIYVVPPFLAAASAGAGWIWTRRAKSFVYRVLSLSLVASTLASFAVSFGMLAVSRLNYPGADALNRLHDLASNDTGLIRVHMDTLACTTGITRFMEKPPPPLLGDDENAAFWVYDKTEDEQKLLDPLFWKEFDYALSERPERVIGRWEVLEAVEGFAGVGILRAGEDDVKNKATMGSRSSLMKVWHDRKWNRASLIHDLQELAKAAWSEAEIFLKQYVTRGWWFEIKMEPRISILKREKGPFLMESFPSNEGD